MKSTLLLMIISVLALIGSGCTTNHEQEASSIDLVRQAFNAAFTAEDIQALDAIIDDQAIWSILGQPPVHGKDSILASYERTFPSTRSWLEINEGDLQIAGNWAIMTTTYNRSDTFYCKENETKVVNIIGHNMLVFKKQADKSWKIARDIWNEPAPKACCKTEEKTYL